jgi:hypothetical protein
MRRSLAYNSKYALNAICPYFTMFPLEYPFRILKKHKKELPIVLDPFCGRGTTIYAARELGLSSWGIDTSPIAVAIAKAKLATASLIDVLELAEKLIAKGPTHIPSTEFFRAAYAEQTLIELCALREGLLSLRPESDASILLRAAALGCLHGPLSKTALGAGYFSNQMPRTFASKPGYSVNFWKKRELEAPSVRVLDVLNRKLSRITNIDIQSTGKPSQILCADSRLKRIYKKIPDNFSLVITSPPYYGMQTYIQDQWLRMWFLGGPEAVSCHDENQLDHKGKDAFIDSMASVWRNIYNSRSDKLDLYIRFGSVPSKNSDAKCLLKSSLEDSGRWKIISVRNAGTAHAGCRQANQMITGSRAAAEYDFHAVRI